VGKEKRKSRKKGDSPNRRKNIFISKKKKVKNTPQKRLNQLKEKQKILQERGKKKKRAGCPIQV